MSWLDDGAELTLTPREQEILEFVAKGLSAKEIAGQIGIAPRTVEGHIDSVRLKVRARNKAHMVTQAVLAGVLKLGEPGRNGHPSAEELRLAADPTGKPPHSLHSLIDCSAKPGLAPRPCHAKGRARAPVAELVDALDSKSSSQKECPFDPDRGHHPHQTLLRARNAASLSLQSHLACRQTLVKMSR